MPVTYTSRKGVTHYLCRGVTKTGKPRYHFAQFTPVLRFILADAEQRTFRVER